jgi:hypothetical protein
MREPTRAELRREAEIWRRAARTMERWDRALFLCYQFESYAGNARLSLFKPSRRGWFEPWWNIASDGIDHRILVACFLAAMADDEADAMRRRPKQKVR